MSIRSAAAILTLAAGLVLAIYTEVRAQGLTSDKVVKAAVTTDKPGADGKQVLTITLDIDSKYHIYANPVGNEDFASNQTTLNVTGKAKLESVKVDYPTGEVVKDKTIGDYKIYTGKVTLKATVQRARGDTGPLDVAIKVQACTKKACLMPGTLKVAVP